MPGLTYSVHIDRKPQPCQGLGGVPVQGSQAGIGLRHGVDDLAGDLDPLPSRRELPLVEVDVDPWQAEQFATPHARHAGQVPQRVQWIFGDAVEEVAELGG